MQKNKLSPYWICQIAGWGGASLYWVYHMVIDGTIGFVNGTLNIGLTIVSAILITHAYYVLARRYKWHLLSVKSLLPILLVAIIPLAAAFCLANILINFFTYKLIWPTVESFATANWLNIFVTGGRLMAIWLLAFHLYHYAKRGAETEAEKAQLEVKAAEAQMEILKTQLNPHFLFNALNSVKAMILEEPNKARRAVVLLSDVLRNSLNVSKKKFVTINEELSHVRDYLEIEKMRFEERLGVKYAIDKNTEMLKVLPLCIQVLAENAIKHGIGKRIEGGRIEIKTQKLENHVLIEVLNDGALKSDPDSPGIGLNNLRERLALHFGNKAQLKITQANNQKVSATIKLPLIHD